MSPAWHNRITQCTSLTRRALTARAILLTIALFVVAGCASAPQHVEIVEPEQLPDYRLDLDTVDSPEVSPDGYKLLLRFELRSRERFPYRYLIQEITQRATYTTFDGEKSDHVITLVETFRLNNDPEFYDEHWIYTLEPYQRDKHFESGFATTPTSVARVDVRRDVRLYAGMVKGADFTKLGFAHLPHNRDAGVITRIPSNFNRAYQGNHDTRGTIIVDDRSEGSRLYRIKYNWKRSRDGTMHATFNFDPDIRQDQPTTTISSTSHPTTAGAGAGDED